MNKLRLWFGGALLLASGGCIPENFWSDLYGGVMDAVSASLLTRILQLIGLG